jgi:hypothetical protein
MSVTVLVDKKRLDVELIEWFRGRKFWTLQYPSPPIRQLKYNEFRLHGYSIIHEHFVQYKARRIEDGDPQLPLPLFTEKGQEKKYFKGKVGIFVSRRQPETLSLLPYSPKAQSLIGFGKAETESRRINIRFDSSPGIFWKAFDEVLLDLR